MKTRAITGFFFVIVMLASVLLGHYTFGIFYLALSVFCLWEFFGLVKIALAQHQAFKVVVVAFLLAYQRGVRVLYLIEQFVSAVKILFP